MASGYLTNPAAAGAALFLCLISSATGEASVALDSKFDATLEEIQQRSPYKYVRDAMLAAEGETKAIVCSFDSLYTAGKHWKRTFYSPISWFSYQPGASQVTERAAEDPIANGKTLHLAGGKTFGYKMLNPMTVAPSSILVLENVPLQLSGTYFVCKTNLQPGSVQVFYLKVIKPALYTPSPSSGRRIVTRLGAKLKLDCHTANNFPLSSVYWSRHRPGAKLTIGAGQPAIAWGPTYEVSKVTMETASYRYTCHVNNHLDPEWSASFRVDLINATKLRPGPITATYNGVRSAFRSRSSQALPSYRSTYTMSCRVQGDGVKFTWLRNGTELRPYGDPNLYTYSSSVGNQHFSDLMLKKFRPQDRGIYECAAKNEAGDSRFQFDLFDSVRTPPESPGTGPGFPGGPQWNQWSQQHLGSGWGAGSGDNDPGEGAPSGGRLPPLPPRRARRHSRTRRLL